VSLAVVIAVMSAYSHLSHSLI